MFEDVSSRRAFLRTTGLLAGSALAFRYAPSGLLDVAQTATPNGADSIRTRMGVAAIEKTMLADRLVMLSGPGGNVVVFHGPGGKIVVDGFVQPAWPRLKAVLDGLDGSPIKSLIDTHWHVDHTDNNANFRAAGAGVIAHENTKKQLRAPHDLFGMHFDPAPSAALPAQTFAAGLTLNLNGEQINLTHVEPAHTDGDIFVYFPRANVLHLGDVFFNGMYPVIDASTGGHISGMIDGVQRALKMANPQTKIVPGHGALARYGSLESYGRMLTAIRDRVQKLKAEGRSLAATQASHPSAEFDATWGKGMLGPDDFIALVYNTLR
jgi:cyclase